MRRHTTSSRARARKGRLGLIVLAATVAAFLVVPVAQAAAASVKVNVVGSGTVKGIELYVEHEPPINCPSACESSVEEYAALAAIPAKGSKFVGWTINEGFAGLYCDGSEEEKKGAEDLGKEFPEYAGAEGECFVVEEGGKIEITATFEPTPEPNLEVIIEEGKGTVVSNPAGISCEPTCSAKFEVGKKVTLTASPAPGYAFKSWKGCVKTTEGTGVNGRQCTVETKEGLITVGVKFYKVWRLSGSKSIGNGIFSTSPGGVNCGYGCLSSAADYKEGSLIIKAKPAKYFHFVEFTGGTNSATVCNGVKTPECTIEIKADSAIKEVYAEDAKNTLTLTKEGGGQGFIKTKPTNINCGYTCASAKAEFYAAETPEVTVVLNKGTTSVTWVKGAGTCTGKVLTCSVPMSSSKELVAKFD